MRIDPNAIAQAILSAPGWARVGITAPSEFLREDAAHEMAIAIVAGITEPESSLDVSQLNLAL